MKKILALVILLRSFGVNAQTCICEKEFLYIKNVIEKNFAGFSDREKAISKAVYKKETDQLLKLTHDRFATDNCPLIINHYLALFKSNHLGFSNSFDVYKTDTDFVNHRPLFPLTDVDLKRLKESTSWEGIYYFTHDSSAKVAVIKDPTALHDYIGVILESTRPTWKKGMIKFEGKLVNDSLMMGLLYMRNHRAKMEGFGLWDNNNMISGDWRREGSVKPVKVLSSFTNGSENEKDIDAKSLTPQTLYIKIASFETEFKSLLDSVLKANEALLSSIPNLILDLRDNGGGSDDLWQPLIPYFYTGPIKSTGVDILATETTITGWKKYLQDDNLSKESIADIQKSIDKMQKGKGGWVNIADDAIDSSMRKKLFPKKIAVIMNRWCGSSTEEFLLAARQSSKVILVGENTIGNLDYSNVVQTPFSCFPYTLKYATTRSRRLDIQQGIDNVGITPEYHLSKEQDWIKETVKILEEVK